MKKPISVVVIFFSMLSIIFAQHIEKRPLDHSVYDSWKAISHQIISDNGELIAYEINPQQGDGWLYIYNKKNSNYDSIPRGIKPVFSPDNNWLCFTIKPPFDTVHKAKLNKVKKDKLPKDSLGIWIPERSKIIKLGKLKSFQTAKIESGWIAVYLENVKPPKKKADTNINNDSTLIKKIDNKTKNKERLKKSGRLVMLDPVSGDSVLFNNVSKYAFSNNGTLCAMIQTAGDSIDSVRITVYNTLKKQATELFVSKGFSNNISVSEQGDQVAFTYSVDTAKNKAFGLYYYNVKNRKLINVSGDHFNRLHKDWSVSTHGKIFFNKAGNELYFGQAQKPKPKVKDTLTEDEKVSLDIWTWHDEYLQPMQKLRKDSELRRSYSTVFFPKEDKVVQLESEDVETVLIDKKESGKFSLAFDNKPYRIMTSWDAYWYKDYYLVNRQTGAKKLILRKCDSRVILSPNQQFVLWYNAHDSTWNSYNIKLDKSICLTRDVNVPFYNEENDVPRAGDTYGFAGWTKKGEAIVYDKYDLWVLDPSGKIAAKNLTHSFGRTHNLSFRYLNLDKELRVLPEKMLLSAFNDKNKQAGFFTLTTDDGSLQKLLMDDFRFTQVKKAKKADVLLWRKESFKQYPELYFSDLNFSKAKKITNTNPQQKNYWWGTVELVSWITFDGDSMQGLLYKPENFDPSKKYPMIVYFYERYSNSIHRHYAPKPIRSVINFTYYVSNGYMIFIPDIKYKTGYPGPSAFNCIISGTQSMCNKHPYIDRSRLGIQGQSWGGYQSAYIITQTDMFAAAEAGAPVSNMTSAYGGIRWGSGMSRAFQYEQTQSRIGGDLWDKLPLYILNSPLFFAPRVNTPLLMMHNDKDGAVPWYQGIEYFNALRRLRKPVWMLVYNGAPHNLKRRADEKDLTRRMQQFFDHYLKGAPEPVWMSKGVPAVKKGKTFGFETE